MTALASTTLTDLYLYLVSLETESEDFTIFRGAL